jgi:protein gp37
MIVKKKTKIEWSEESWNPITGCDKVSAGCKNCYAARISNNLHGYGVKKYRNGFKVTMHPDSLNEPYLWMFPKIIFVNSMSDLFHSDVPEDFIKKVFEVMNDTLYHTYIILTKRPERLLELNEKLNWTFNIVMGVSVENQDVVDRIDDLRKTDAITKFISFEPLLGPLTGLNVEGVDWVVVGGESGPNARPMKKNWALEILEHCTKLGTPYFFKQWGTWGSDGVKRNRWTNGNELNGRVYNEYPKFIVEKHFNF